MCAHAHTEIGMLSKASQDKGAGTECIDTANSNLFEENKTKIFPK